LRIAPPAEDPVIVSVYEPLFVFELVSTRNVEDEEVGLGLNDVTAPDGAPDTLRFTDPLKPFVPLTETRNEACELRATD
jgi:hypothetical protein